VNVERTDLEAAHTPYGLRDDMLPERLHLLTPDQRVEAAMLGVLVLSAQRFAQAVRMGASEDWFTLDVHRRIWTLMAGLAAKGVAFDALTLEAEVNETRPVLGLSVGDLAATLEGTLHDAFFATYSRRLAHRCAERRAAGILAVPQRGLDAEDYAGELIHKSGELIGLAEEILDDGSTDPREGMIAAAAEIQQAREQGLGLTTGLHRLDALFRGWRRAEVIVCGARPRVGKSAMGVTVTEHLLRTVPDCVVFYGSAEMRDHEIRKRLISARSMVSSASMEEGTATGDEHAAWADALQDYELHPPEITHKGMKDPRRLRARARELKLKHGRMDLVIVDHIHSMIGEGRSRTEQVTNLCAQMQEMAHELDCPVLVLAQLNRGIEAREDKTPQLSDLRESGALEQDADIVFFLHRELGYEGDPSRLAPTTSVNVAKHRRGSCGAAQVHFHETVTRFFNAAPMSALPAGERA
jgi:replicative DNA helicase